MMRLQSIRYAEPDTYELVVEADGATQSIVCRVVAHRGIRGVQTTPDLMTRSPYDPRLVIAAVLAFHDARKAEETGPSGDDEGT
jgi:hypothetical protein